MAVFYRQDIENKSSTELTRISELTAKLEELKKQVKKNPEIAEEMKKTREELLGLRREFNRTKQYTEVARNKLAEGKNSLDSISAADLMRLDKEVSKERRGEFLSKSFLYKRVTDTEGNITEEATDGKSLKEGDQLYVDFGKNRSANMRIGLGHMLGVDIGYVKVDGKVGVRSIVNGRVGYYTKGAQDGYIPVYNGSLVTIPTASEIGDFEKSKDAKLSRNTNQKESDENNDAYINKLENTSIEAIEINVNTRESYDFWKEKGLSHEQICGLLANEFAESNFNPGARGDGGKAHGIFQWHPDRREHIRNGFGIDISTASHKAQLEAAYWEMTKGQESKVWGALIGTKTARESAEIFTSMFERPSDIIEASAKRGQMAEAYSILLDENGRSTNLGDHVVRKGPAKLGPDSCGAAVRELLKGYGITGLPETGADGKNWEKILNDRPHQFVKMRISHPDYAYPGAILVYDGSGDLGSQANKKHGHVEIKGNDGKYYSYYESYDSAGSAKTGTKNPQQFQEETGFIGYAYYPKQSV